MRSLFLLFFPLVTVWGHEGIPSEVLSYPQMQQSYFSVAPGYSNTRSSIQLPRNSYTLEQSHYSLGLGFDYGVTQQYSFGLSSSVGEVSTKYSDDPNTYRSTGLGDLSISNLLVIPAAPLLQAGLRINLSPGRSELSSAKVAGNRFSGGHSVEAKVAYEGYLTTGLVAGGLISYTIRDRRESVSIGQSGNVLRTYYSNGGNTLTVGPHFEYKRNLFALGLQPTIRMVESTSYSSSSVGLADNTSDAVNYLDLEMYSAIPFDKEWSFIPKVSYRTLLSREINKVRYEYFDQIGVSVMSRLVF